MRALADCVSQGMACREVSLKQKCIKWGNMKQGKREGKALQTRGATCDRTLKWERTRWFRGAREGSADRIKVRKSYCNIRSASAGAHFLLHLEFLTWQQWQVIAEFGANDIKSWGSFFKDLSSLLINQIRNILPLAVSLFYITIALVRFARGQIFTLFVFLPSRMPKRILLEELQKEM